MNSKDIQNLSEAYLSIYAQEDFVDLTPEKEERVKKHVQGLLKKYPEQHGELQRRIAQFHARKRNPVTRFLFGTQRRRDRVVETGKGVQKTVNQLKTSMDSLTRTNAGRRARIKHFKNIEAPRNIIVPFHREELEFILNHLIQEGYADSYESASAILGSMSEEWSYEILNEGSLYDMFKAHNDEIAASIQRDKERAARIKALSDTAAQFAAPHTRKQSSSSGPKRSTQEIISDIKKKLDDAEEVMRRQDKTK